MGRVYNFSAGPAVLPEEVLREAADEMLEMAFGTSVDVRRKYLLDHISDLEER